MKIKEKQLRQIIREEMQKVLNENNVPKSYPIKFVSWFTSTALNTVKHPIYGQHKITPEQLKKSDSSYINKLYKIINKAYKNGDIDDEIIKKHNQG